jgi:DNA-directed RNA polymerase alpha subunit
VDRIVAYGNAVQSHLLSPVASSTRLHLSALDLPQLTYGALRRAGYTYTDEVSGLTDAQLLTVRNLGPKGVGLLRDKLLSAKC